MESVATPRAVIADCAIRPARVQSSAPVPRALVPAPSLAASPSLSAACAFTRPIACAASRPLSTAGPQPFVGRAGPSQRGSLACRASSGDDPTSARSRAVQVDATRLLAELLQAKELEAAVTRRVDDLTEEFFMVGAAYLDMARKEGNPEVVRQLESVMRTAMEEKNKTLRPEIRMLNQLLREKTSSERTKTLSEYSAFLSPGSYFFHLLNRMLVDVEGQRPPQTKLLAQIRTISKEAKEAAKEQRKAVRKGAEETQ